jgi:hypothetical protein
MAHHGSDDDNEVVYTIIRSIAVVLLKFYIYRVKPTNAVETEQLMQTTCHRTCMCKSLD